MLGSMWRLVVFKSMPAKIEEALREKKNILIHIFGKGLLERYIRVSVGSKKAMKLFSDAYFEIDGTV